MSGADWAIFDIANAIFWILAIVLNCVRIDRNYKRELRDDVGE